MGLLRKKVSDEVLLQRARLGVLEAAESLIKLALKKGICVRPLDVVGLAKALGIEVIQVELEDKHSGYLKKEGDVWVCAVNRKHHPTRQRFTIAHEVGHYVLHKNDHDLFDTKVRNRADVDILDPEEEKMETEANRFAAELLMPEGEFKQRLTLDKDFGVVASYFDVSPLAVNVRARLLGLTSW